MISLLLRAALALTLVNAIPHDGGYQHIEKRQWTIGQAVKTTSGNVIGHAAKDKTQVSEYLGIPFAKPPVGDLRWAPPVKFTGNGNINASQYSLDCAATFQNADLALGVSDLNANPSGIILLTELMQLGHPVTEDCLTINIWSKPQVGEKAKAVLFWVYGGGFATGNSANKIYDGQYIADSHDVIVVSFNYRENIFGFPGVDDPTVAKNAALLDQRLALEWVRDNIAGFGGDPKRIVMFGESAGGASIDFYTYAYPDDPIVSGTILESGSVYSFADPQPANNLDAWNKAAAALTCPTASTSISESVKCMRSKPMDDILRVTKVENPLQAVLGFFGPTIDNKVVFGDYEARAKAGKFIQKPYMTGNNDHEAGLFEFIGGAAKIKIPANIWSVFNAAVFTCPVARAANARAGKVPTWRFRYFGDWPNTNLMPSSGAYHTAEIPMIFGTSATVTSQANTAPQQRVSDFMMQTWAAFAKDPLSISKPPFNLPQYNPETAYTENTMIGFGANNVTRQLLPPANYDMYCGTIDSIVKSIPGGVFGAITSVATGKEMGVPGLKNSEIPDMSPLPLPAPPAGAV